jgi:L-cystine uptake protein TcyP (sodium:dicarboxylate symporter family)
MFESWNPVLLNGVGVVGLSVFIVLGFVFGFIVSRREHQQVIDDRDHWRKLAEDQQERLTKLLIMSELGINSLRAIEQKANAREGGDG